MWSLESGSCQLTIRNAKHNNPGSDTADNAPLAHEVLCVLCVLSVLQVNHAQFFYLDKFVVLSAGRFVCG